MNVINKLVLVAFGVAGIAIGSNVKGNVINSIWYSRAVFLAMGLLAILGLIPATNTLNGYVPLYGADVVVHAVIAVIGLYFGYGLSMKAKKVNQEKFGRDLNDTSKRAA
jgi:hypothetical protein